MLKLKGLKNLSSCQKNGFHFLGGGGGSDPKVIKITFFNPSLTQTLLGYNTYIRFTRPKKYNVINKQTDTVVLFSGH